MRGDAESRIAYAVVLISDLFSAFHFFFFNAYMSGVYQSMQIALYSFKNDFNSYRSPRHFTFHLLFRVVHFV